MIESGNYLFLCLTILRTGCHTVQDFQTIESLKAELAQVVSDKNRLLEMLSALLKSDSTAPFIASLVHELAQPLAATRINIYTQSATPMPQQTIQSYQETLQRIDSDTERAIYLVNKLRDLFTASPAASSLFSRDTMLEELTSIFQHEPRW